MVQYEVTVLTGDRLNSTTLNNVFIKLVGTDGESDRTWLMGLKGATSFVIGAEVQFSFTKNSEFFFTASTGLTELKLKGLDNCKKKWDNIDSINRVLCCKKTDISEYVHEHWKEDAFFNPMLIQLCTALPSNFPVTDDMVFPHGQCSLAGEMKKGNIFLCDYKRLDGEKSKHHQREEALLKPHTRYSPHVNLLARSRLISETGSFTQFVVLGGEGMVTILQMSVSSMTYSSLCMPDDIAERGLEAVLNFYYRDDGLKIWDIIHRAWSVLPPALPPFAPAPSLAGWVLGP
nr:PREDICTED: arachidonate 12-lipoxygenase, 12R-type-like [Pundamilia nyererei]